MHIKSFNHLCSHPPKSVRVFSPSSVPQTLNGGEFKVWSEGGIKTLTWEDVVWHLVCLQLCNNKVPLDHLYCLSGLIKKKS